MRLWVTTVVFGAMATLVGCGGSDPITVAVSPSSVTLTGGSTQQFTATVSGTSNATVDWQVNGITGGDASHGLITSTGLYTAPALASAGSITVTAASRASAASTGAATVTLAPGTISVTPATATIRAGQQQTFAATVGTLGVSPQWSVGCDSAVAEACGTITAAGVYTAPLSPPPGGKVTITASTSGGTSLPGNASLTLVFGNASLSGPYAFSTISGNGSYIKLGSITFDGAGNVVGGYSRGGQFDPPDTFNGGTYHVGADGRATLTLRHYNYPSSIDTWQLVLMSHDRARAIRSGETVELDLQNPSHFAKSAIAGRYAVSLRGWIASRYLGYPGVRPPQTGTFVLDASGNVTSAILHTPEPYVKSFPVSGSYSGPQPPGLAPFYNGSGEIILDGPWNPSLTTTAHFPYFVADATHLRLAVKDCADCSYRLLGDLFRQPAPPFSNTSLKGRYTFMAQGTAGNAPLAAAGAFVADGNGNISGGLLDVSTGGATDSSSFTGLYNVTDADSGEIRMTATSARGSSNFVLYPRADGGFVLYEDDAVIKMLGRVLPQTSLQQLGGSFALDLQGSNFASLAEVTGIGRLLATGSSWNGALDLEEVGTSFLDASATLENLVVDLSTGRGTALLQTSAAAMRMVNLIVYVVGPDLVFLVETNGSRALTGTLTRQY